jgi:KDO2-lipid IV(A) lauroyltransferase
MARARSLYAPAVWPTWLGLGMLRLAAVLPYAALLAVARFAGRATERLVPARRRIVDRNLALCFPELDEAQRRALRRRHFESVGMGVFEFAIAWWWGDRRVLALTEVAGKSHLEAARRSGRGIIFLSAHTTSLEVGGRVLQSLLPIHAMYRRNENPVLQRFLETNRSRHVAGIIQRDKPRQMMRVLKKGGAVWYAPDQNYRGKGFVFADFFGMPAATNPATSRFAAATGAVVVPMVVLRRPGGGYRVLFEPAFTDFPTDDPARDARRMNAVIENWVRQAPEQYNWLHRRFKTRPAGAPPLY